MARIRLTHIDGKLPNLALMKLAAWHQEQGDQIFFSRFPTPRLEEPHYDQVYVSSIFDWSREHVAQARLAFPEAIVGGTGVKDWETLPTVEQTIGLTTYEKYDYSLYPEYPWSIGFTARGCRLNCKFCSVPKKEGKPRSVNTIWAIWRPSTPRNIHLLDNDFFGQPAEAWKARLSEAREGNFRICFNQGINVRAVTPEIAAELATVRYFDDQFGRHRLYTAWDNLGDERAFFRGQQMLADAGIPAKHLMVFMLVGFAPGETMEQVQFRYQRLKATGCMPFPMVFRASQNYKELRRFARWVIRRYDTQCSFADFGKAA